MLTLKNLISKSVKAPENLTIDTRDRTFINQVGMTTTMSQSVRGTGNS
jgi:redox-regulated HSP33 family molecular chaperone